MKIRGDKLSKAVKVSTAKALSELDYTQKEIAEVLGISPRSVWRYLNECDDDKWRIFSDNIKKLVLVKEEQVASKALKHIDDKVPRAQFRDLVGLYKILRELRMNKPNVAIQQNFNDFKLDNDQLERIIEGTDQS